MWGYAGEGSVGRGSYRQRRAATSHGRVSKRNSILLSTHNPTMRVRDPEIQTGERAGCSGRENRTVERGTENGQFEMHGDVKEVARLA